MSLRGRYIIDRIKRAVGGRIRLPAPPYHDPAYWDGVYRKLGASDVFEWGHLSSRDLLNYKYKLLSWKMETTADDGANILFPSSSRPTISTASQVDSTETTTTLAETLGVHDDDDDDDENDSSNDSNNSTNSINNTKPILMLGCGNSALGPDMIDEGNFVGPIYMVDVSARVIDSMSLRYHHLQTSGDLLFVQDDGTVLSAFDSLAVDAVLDKGLMDAIFCADDLEACWKILTSVHRVLKDGGCFVCLSFSKPEYLWQQVILSQGGSKANNASSSSAQNNNKRLQWFQAAWQDVQVRQLDDRILVYRFQKATTKKPPPISLQSSSSRRRPTMRSGTSRHATTWSAVRAVDIID